ncbi:hypothetical protein CARUB_v10010466mg [Capsella rubella]|uniref:Mitochondrial import inner membrane translocase subunit TIM22 n=1 Tax=Capsella rubella TaxID=81985 RepID=R0IJF7_9BRAS|nr:mitochondrial import inner membrane translocase subunit TIM22-4 [Capsella rubella]EOA38615.1 hypothetical protein CARUB_v10010466mg [Capsella rubella]
MADSSAAEPTGPTPSTVGSDENATQIQPIRMPTIEEIRAQEVWNNCAVRAVTSGVMGGGLGLMMGLFLGALDNPITNDTMTARQQFVFTAKQMGQRSWNSCKTFAVMGLVFSAAECIVEKARAKHDTTNTAIAGCVTGGSMSARGGPKAACIGCAGFATFSVLIEKFFDRHT